jgi:hypothetical protein
VKVNLRSGEFSLTFNKFNAIFFIKFLWECDRLIFLLIMYIMINHDEWDA